MHHAPDGPRAGGATSALDRAATRLPLRAPALAALALAAALAAAAAPLRAQATRGDVSFDGYGGVALPAGALGDVTDPGAATGLEMAWHLSRRVALRGGVDVQFLQGASDGRGVTYPDMDVVHVGAGVEVTLFDEEGAMPVTGAVGAGAAASRLDLARTLDDGSEPPQQLEFRQTYPSFRGSVKLSRRLGGVVAVYLEPSAHLVLTDRGDTRFFAQVSGSPDIRPFSTAWVVPLTAGVRVTLR